MKCRLSFAIRFPSTNPRLPKQQNLGVSIPIRIRGTNNRHIRLASGWLLVLVCFERKVLLASG
jgi:hypothetical protein